VTGHNKADLLLNVECCVSVSQCSETIELAGVFTECRISRVFPGREHIQSA